MGNIPSVESRRAYYEALVLPMLARSSKYKDVAMAWSFPIAEAGRSSNVVPI